MPHLHSRSGFLAQSHLQNILCECLVSHLLLIESYHSPCSLTSFHAVCFCVPCVISVYPIWVRMPSQAMLSTYELVMMQSRNAVLHLLLVMDT